MDINQGVENLIDFIYNSPTAYQAVDNIKEILDKNGFKEINQNDNWELEKNSKYYVVANNSALIAMDIGEGNLVDNGFRIIGAHTDSPTFKIKPVSQMVKEDKYIKLNTEVYGGPIYSTWFDRPLSLAGQVVLKGESTFNPIIKNINIKRPILIIPNLAIHFNREINKGYEYNAQRDTLPILGFINEELENENYLLSLLASELDVDIDEILDFELFLYEFDKGRIIGLNEEFISSPRLDDLWMVHGGLQGLINSKKNEGVKLLVCVDHEEIGSQTAYGANSQFIPNTLKRIAIGLGLNEEDYFRALDKSMAISSDLAHGVHPNYLDKHDETNRPVLGNGPVIKYSAAQKYITTGFSASVFSQCCENAGVPYQKYANRSDVAGGSTIAKFLAAILCIDVVDVGNPILAMHSIRELGAVVDNDYIERAFAEFYSAK